MMPSAAGRGGGDRGACHAARDIKARHQILRKERGIDGRRDDKVGIVPLRDIIECSEHSRQWTFAVCRVFVGNNWNAERCVACGIVVGADDEAATLRREPRDAARQQCCTAQQDKRFVRALKTLRTSAGEDDTGRLQRCGNQKRTQTAEKAPRSAPVLTPRWPSNPPTCTPKLGVTQ